MASANVGRLVYDLIANTSEFNAAIGVASQRIGDLKRLFLDSRSDAEKFGMEFDVLAKVGRTNNEWMQVASRRFSQIAAQSTEATATARAYTRQLKEQTRQLENYYQTNAMNQRRGIRTGEFEDLENRKKLISEMNKQIDVREREAAAIRRTTEAQERDAAAAKRNAEAQEKLAAARSRAKATAKAQAGTAFANEASKVNAFLEKQQTVAQRAATMMGALRNQYIAGTITEKQYAAGKAALVLMLREEKQRVYETSEAYEALLASKLKVQQQQAASRNRLGQITQRLTTQEEKLKADIHFLNKQYAMGVVPATKYAAIHDRLTAKLRELGNEAVKTKKKMGLWQTSFGGVIKNITAMGLAFRASRFAIEAFKMAMDIEKAQVQFAIFTGSLNTAKNLMQDLRRIAAETPLTLDVSMQSTRTLLQYGVAASEVTGRLKQLGDIAGGDTERMQRLSLAFGQISAQGRLQGQELRQLVESGFNPLSEMARTTGRDMLSLRIAMSEGAISIEDVEAALDSATSQGGRFHGQLDKVVELTASGKWQRAMGMLRDSAATALGGTAEDSGAIADGIYEATAQTNSLLQSLNQFRDTLQQIRRGGGDAAAVSGLVGPLTNPGIEYARFQRDIKEGNIFYEDRLQLLDVEQNYLTEEEQATKKATENIGDRIVEERKKLRVLKYSTEQLELQKLLEMARDANVKQADIDRLLRIIQMRKEEEKRQEQEKKHEAEMKKAREQAIRDRKREAEQLQKAATAVVEANKSPREKLMAELSDVNRLRQAGALNNEQAIRAFRRLIGAFFDQNYKAEKRDTLKREKAPVVSLRSRAEYDLMGRMFAERLGKQQEEKIRHQEAQDKREAMRILLESIKNEGIPMASGEAVEGVGS